MKVHVEMVNQSPTTPLQSVDYLVSFTEMDNPNEDDNKFSDMKLLITLDRIAKEILKQNRPELFGE